MVSLFALVSTYWTVGIVPLDMTDTFRANLEFKSFSISEFQNQVLLWHDSAQHIPILPFLFPVPPLSALFSFLLLFFSYLYPLLPSLFLPFAFCDYWLPGFCFWSWRILIWK